MKSILPVIFVVSMLAGGMLTSCKKHLTEPPQDTTHKCDTCHTDTTHHPCDTCNKPCDTCNLNKDSLSHAFTWKEYTIPGESNLGGVWVFGQNDMIIVGDRLWHFDGVTFSPIDAINSTHQTGMNSGLSGFNIFAFSQTDYWLVHGSIVFHTSDGKYFDDNRKGAVNACWGKSSNDMFFVGDGGHIFHYDGTSFLDMVSNTTKKLNKVWGTSHNNVWAGGSDLTTGDVTLLHFDGQVWTNVDLSTIGQFGCANCEALTSIWVVDSLNDHKTFVGGGRIHRETNNLAWITDNPDDVGNKLSDNSFISLSTISGNSSTDFMTSGDWGFVSHWNGKTWKRYDTIYNSGNPDYATQAFRFSSNTACLVGFKNGQSWIAVGTRK